MTKGTFFFGKFLILLKLFVLNLKHVVLYQKYFHLCIHILTLVLFAVWLSQKEVELMMKIVLKF